MPTYEYTCPECQEEFELMRPMCDSGATATCPQCGAQSKRVMSVFASKADYTIKVPTKAAFRGEKAKAAPKAGTAKAAAPKARKKAAR